MRDNPGGIMEVFNQFMNNLLPRRRLLFTLVHYGGRESQLRTSGRDDYRLDVEIVVLINARSGSASEMFAVAMMEAGGFEVIGTTSMGKGVGQSLMEIGDGILSINTWEAVPPSGNPYDGYGVTPTIYVEAPEFYYFSHLHLGRGVVLEYDMVDSRISNAQLILDALGYGVVRTDGYFDTSTVEAVRLFQQNNDLNETGYLNSETATALSLALVEKIQNPEDDLQLLAAIDFLID